MNAPVRGAVILLMAGTIAGFPLVAAAGETKTAAKACASATGPVHEARFVSIGGIEQWVTIDGKSCANPVILFLHGGPGNTLSPYAHAIYGAWESEFTLVQWDQRGSGRTYGRNGPPAAGLTLERMTQDGVALTEYLTRYLGKKKIILTGGSWGSILGVHMVKSRPDLFHAYVGIAQMVSYRENQSASYSRVLALARDAGDQSTLGALEAIGAPPWTNPRNFGVLRRATRSYEAKVTDPEPSAWGVRAAGYDTPQAQADYSEGEDYSFLQFLGLKGDGMFSRVDLPRLGTRFGLPVFIIQGSEDLVAMPDIARRYLESLTAPQKEFVLVPRTGHDLNPALIAAQRRIMSERVRPLAK